MTTRTKRVKGEHQQERDGRETHMTEVVGFANRRPVGEKLIDGISSLEKGAERESGINHGDEGYEGGGQTKSKG